MSPHCDGIILLCKLITLIGRFRCLSRSMRDVFAMPCYYTALILLFIWAFGDNIGCIYLFSSYCQEMDWLAKIASYIVFYRYRWDFQFIFCRSRHLFDTHVKLIDDINLIFSHYEEFDAIITFRQYSRCRHAISLIFSSFSPPRASCIRPLTFRYFINYWVSKTCPAAN